MILTFEPSLGTRLVAIGLLDDRRPIHSYLRVSYVVLVTKFGPKNSVVSTSMFGAHPRVPEI